MTIDNWLELELVRGINDQSLQKRLLQERNPMLQDMISIATQWQSAETTMAQFIVDNESIETDSESEEVNNTNYERTSNRSKGTVSGNLNYTCNQKEKEENTQMNGNKWGKDDSPTDTSTSGEDGRVQQAGSNHTSRKPEKIKSNIIEKIAPIKTRYVTIAAKWAISRRQTIG